MHLRTIVIAAAITASAFSAAAQDRRGPEETERITHKFRIGANGRFSLANVSGDIAVTSGSGDDVSIAAVKRTRGSRSELESVVIEIDDRQGRVDIRTRHTSRRNRASVDYTVTVPRDATVDLSSVSGDVRVTNVRGALRAQSVSGTVIASGATNVEMAKSISGDVELTGSAPDARMTGSTVSGTVRARDVKARSLALSTISGSAEASNIEAERLEMKTVSGDVIFAGAPSRNGRYEFNAHSGSVRLKLGGAGGYELDASTFSGAIRSDLPVTVNSSRGTRRGSARSLRTVVGDGAASIAASTFSGNITIERR